MNRLRLASIAAVAAMAPVLAHATQFAYPAKGQDQATQTKDQTECSAWAMQQSGYDPAKTPPAQAPAAAGSGKTTTNALMEAVNGLGGAAGTSSAVTAMTGNAKLGGAASLLGGYMSQKPAAQPVASAAAPSPDADFLRARAVCLSARGYTVQ